jgi:hypothetical protein
MVILGVWLLPLIPFLGMAKFLGELNLVFIVITIIVAIFLYQRFRFIQYFIIDKGMSVVAASKASWKLTQGTFFHLCIYSIVTSLLFFYLGSVILFKLFMLIYKQADVNIYKQMTE